MHDTWYVFPRKLPPSKRHPQGRTVFYYNCWIGPNKRSTAWSTGCTTRKAAIAHVRDLERDGKLIPEHSPDAPLKYRTFADLSRGFWDPGSEYCRGQRAFGKPVTEAYAKAAKGIVKKHLSPTFGRLLLENITPDDVERFGLRLFADGKGLSAKRVNNIISILRTMLGHAHRKRCLSWNPKEKEIVRAVAGDSKKRGHLTLQEFRDLFDTANVEKAWKGHTLYRLVNLTAAVCGLRQGEVLALQAADVHDDFLNVDKAWITKTRSLGPTKAKRATPVVPLPEWLRAELQPLVDMSRGGFVFSTTQGRKPTSGNRARLALFDALDAIEVHDYSERNIDFHSWRHYFNSYARSAGVADTMIRLVTGHNSEAMTERYTSLTVDQLSPVAAMQQAMDPNGGDA